MFVYWNIWIVLFSTDFLYFTNNGIVLIYYVKSPVCNPDMCLCIDVYWQPDMIEVFVGDGHEIMGYLDPIH